MAEPTDSSDHPNPQSLITTVQNLPLNNPKNSHSSGEVAEKVLDAVNGKIKTNLEEKLNLGKIECNNKDNNDVLKIECNNKDSNDVLKIVGAGEVGSVGLNAEEVVEKFPKWADDEGEESGEVFYPQRPGRIECAFYMRTGNCGFGLNCKFHHPPRTSLPDQVMRRDSGEATEIAQEKGAEDFLRKSGPIECKYYRLPGGCKYGKSCKYEHPVLEKIEAQPARLNFLGLPVRPGAKNCAYYMHTSACKFSVNCCFNHPEPTDMTGQNYILGHTDESSLQQDSLMVPMSPSPPDQQHTLVVSTSLSCSSDETPSSTVPMSNTLPPYISKMLIPSREANLSSVPKEYQAPVNIHYPTFTKTEQTVDVPSDGTMTIGEYAPSQVQVDFPERPGQLECPFFMKTGNCKFRSRCKFHHPRNHPLKGYTSPHGLPLRPDEPICSSYNRFRICKYGPACKFDHPLDSNSSIGAARSYREIVNARALQMEG